MNTKYPKVKTEPKTSHVKSVGGFAQWLKRSVPGDRCYYYGHKSRSLAVARSLLRSKSKTACSPTELRIKEVSEDLHELANRVWHACAYGEVMSLHKRRLGVPGGFDYMAVRCDLDGSLIAQHDIEDSYRKA